MDEGGVKQLTGAAGGAACNIGSGCHHRLFFLAVTPQRILPTVKNKTVLSRWNLAEQGLRGMPGLLQVPSSNQTLRPAEFF